MSEVETFVKIEGFEKYEVSNLGKVRNIKSGRMLKPHLNHNGYLKHHLYRHDKQKELFLHRILAIAFIDNPGKKPQVNHIDENKLNNDLSNLEWCTGRENLVHGTRTKRVAEKLSKINGTSRTRNRSSNRKYKSLLQRRKKKRWRI